MGKFVVLAIVAAVGYASYQGLTSAPRKPAQSVEPADPLADMAARLKAEQERLRAEEDERGRNSQPIARPAPTPAKIRQFQDPGMISSSPPADNCAIARHNIQATSAWMRQDGTLRERDTKRTLSENEAFALAAQSRQYVEDNCRGR